MAKTKVASSRPAHPEWQATHGTYIAGEAVIAEADVIAHEVEERWGIGRARLLVSTELRERFDRQRYLFNRAIWHGTLEDVRRESKRMAAAWKAVDRVALTTGQHQRGAWVEVALSDGRVAIVVSCASEAPPAAKDGRAVVVYEAGEIKRLLEGFPGLAAVKAEFEGARVEAVRPLRDPLEAIPDSQPGLDDPIPELVRDEL